MTDDPQPTAQWAPGDRDSSRDHRAHEEVGDLMDNLYENQFDEATAIIANAVDTALSHPLFAPRPDETVEAWGRRIGAYDPEADEQGPLQPDEQEREAQQCQARRLVELIHCAGRLAMEIGLDDPIGGYLDDAWEYSVDTLVARGLLPDDYGIDQTKEAPNAVAD